MLWRKERKTFNITNDGFREGSSFWLWFEGNHKRSSGREIMFVDDIILLQGPCPGNVRGNHFIWLDVVVTKYLEEES